MNGGGDALVIRAIVRSAINEHRMRVVGILNGFDGLICPEGAKEMAEETVSGMLPARRNNSRHHQSEESLRL